MLWTWLGVAGDAYRRESGDRSPNFYNLERVRACWRAGGDQLMLFLLLDGSEVYGYALAELYEGPTGRQCFILEGWVAPPRRCLGVLRLALTVIEAWARERNCAGLRFMTFRSPRAYARALRVIGWRPAETTFHKPLEAFHG